MYAEDSKSYLLIKLRTFIGYLFSLVIKIGYLYLSGVFQCHLYQLYRAILARNGTNLAGEYFALAGWRSDPSLFVCKYYENNSVRTPTLTKSTIGPTSPHPCPLQRCKRAISFASSDKSQITVYFSFFTSHCIMIFICHSMFCSTELKRAPTPSSTRLRERVRAIPDYRQ